MFFCLLILIICGNNVNCGIYRRKIVTWERLKFLCLLTFISEDCPQIIWKLISVFDIRTNYLET